MQEPPKKDSFIGLRLPFCEAEKLHKTARDLGITTSELIRRVASDYVTNQVDSKPTL